MPNMTISEASEHFGVSKEAIHNRVRRGSLGVTIINGVKLVEIDADVKVKPHAKARTQVRKTTTVVAEDRYYKLLEEQNVQLQSKVEKLEGETRTLRDQKEQMLIEERVKIEQIYKDKDEQLKNILNTISSEFMLNSPIKAIAKEEHMEAEIEVEKIEVKSELISLKKYLKTQKFTNKKQEKIKNRFKKRAKKDERIISVGSKFYIDTFKYDYKDLLK